MMRRAALPSPRNHAWSCSVLACLATCAAGAVVAAAPAEPAEAAALHAWDGGDDPRSLERWVHAHLRRADEDIARVVAVKGTHTLANTLRPYDDALNELSLASNQAMLGDAKKQLAPKK